MAKVFKGSKEKIFYEKVILKTLLNIIAYVYMLIMLGLLPLYMSDGYSKIGTDKSEFFRFWGIRIGFVALFALVVYILVEIIRGRGTEMWQTIVSRWSVSDSFAVLFYVAVMLSYMLSDYRENAWLGEQGWYLGTLVQMILVLSYLFIAHLWSPHPAVPVIITPITAGIFVLGVLNRFGMCMVDKNVTSANYISTVGNINWYCGYMVIIVFAAVGIFVYQGKTETWMRIVMLVYLVIGFAAVATQGSDSGILALAAVLIALFALTSNDIQRLYYFAVTVLTMAGTGFGIWILRKLNILKLRAGGEYTGMDILTNSVLTPILLVAAAVFFAVVVYMRKKEMSTRVFVILSRVTVAAALAGIAILAGFIAVNTAKGGALSAKLGLGADQIFLFNLKWGSYRGATWKAGVMTFLEQNVIHKLLGVGPDCMEAYIYTNGSRELLNVVTEAFPNQVLTNAHCEMITTLADEGILGLVGYAGLMISAVVRLLKKRENHPMMAGAGLAVLAYLVNNIFSFQQSMSAPTVFIVLAMGEAYYKKYKKKGTSE